MSRLPLFASRLFLTVFLATTFLVPFGSVRADEGDDDYKLALGLYQDKGWTFAEEAFQKFLKKHAEHPRSPLARLYLGLTQVQLEKYAKAAATLRDFIKKHPKSPDVPHAEYRIAECSYHLGNLGDAAKEFQAFSTSHPKDPLNEWAWAYLGDAQRRLGEFAKATVSLQNSLDLFPKGRMADEARFGLAQSTEKLNKTEEAIALYRIVAQDETSKRADSAQLQIGNLLFAAKKFSEATKEYERLPARFPQSPLIPTARLNAGFSLYEQSEFRKAMTAFDQAETGFENRPPVRSQFVAAGYWKGLSLKALGAYDDAAEVLSGVAKAGSEDALAESILYQLADCTFRAGDLATAEQRFLVVTNRWPKGKYGDHSLYFATECALELASDQSGADREKHIQKAGLLLDKFDREYPQSRIRFSHDMQRGHFLILRDSEGDLKAAEELYNRIVSRSQKSQTRGEARFELARLLKNKGDSKAALAMITPLAREVMKDSKAGFPESLILYSHLALSEGNLSAVKDAAESYLKANLAGANRDQAFAYVALASSRAKDWQEADLAIDRLLSDHADSPIVSRTINSVAETAYDGKSWDEAIRFFTILARTGEESPFFPVAESGLGWSHFNKGDFETAAAHFQIVVDKTPKHETAPEAGFKIGECLLKSGKQAESAAAFEAAFAKFQPARRAFLAGIQAARVYVDLADVKSADAAYSAVDKAFVKIAEHDVVLNEWALLLYEAEDYDRSDALFARLVKEHPESGFADNARFSLAESNLVNGEEKKAAAAFAALAADPKADSDVQIDSLYRLVGIASGEEDWKAVATRSTELNGRFKENRYRVEMLFQLGNSHLNQNEFAKAESVLQDVLKSREAPEVAQSDWLPHTWMLLAEAQVRQKSDPKTAAAALVTAKQFRDERPKSPLTYRIDEIAGRALLRQAKFDEARAAFKRVVDSKDGTRTATAAKAQFMIAESFTTQKKYSEAAAAYSRVYILYKHPVWQEPARYQMAICYQALGDKQQAISTFEKFLKEFPESTYRADAEKRLQALR
jgi:cellulose synthase operon protein C